MLDVRSAVLLDEDYGGRAKVCVGAGGEIRRGVEAGDEGEVEGVRSQGSEGLRQSLNYWPSLRIA